MWFKTRTGLVNLSEPLEIMAYQPKKQGTWSLAAHLKNGPETACRTIFGGKISLSGPWFHLAFFADDPDVGDRIGRAMHSILAAVTAEAKVCDLTQTGDADAWDSRWHQISWP